MADVVLGILDDALLDFLFGKSCTLREQFTTAICTICRHCHQVFSVGTEWASVCHPFDGDFLALRTRHIHFVDDACGRVEIEDEIGESHAFGIALHWTEQQEVVVDGVHLVRPVGIAHLEVVLDFLSCETERVDAVFESVEIEKVAHVDFACIDGSIEEERCHQTDVSS